MMTEAPKFSFAIIKHRGDLDNAKTADGYNVHRQEKIWFQGHGYIKCAPMDNHFVYDDPISKKKIGRWTPMCTCGSPAVIIGYNAYAKDASPTTKNESSVPGELICCMSHLQFGLHADGST